MIELLGIVLVVQGIGGFINRVAGSDSESWFIQLHVLPSSLHIVASVVMAIIGGLFIVMASNAKKKQSR